MEDVKAVHCWSCKQILEITDANRGMKIKCPNCGSKQQMPKNTKGNTFDYRVQSIPRYKLSSTESSIDNSMASPKRKSADGMSGLSATGIILAMFGILNIVVGATMQRDGAIGIALQNNGINMTSGQAICLGGVIVALIGFALFAIGKVSTNTSN
jgi:predicted RNA-binding Zn-ribbon protein involved in translation (DUF1610 family)